MKLITAVIGKKDLNPVCDALREAGYSFTKIPTSGGFLRSSNMTLLIGVDDDKLANAVELINADKQNDRRNQRRKGQVIIQSDSFSMCAVSPPPPAAAPRRIRHKALRGRADWMLTGRTRRTPTC